MRAAIWMVMAAALLAAPDRARGQADAARVDTLLPGSTVLRPDAIRAGSDTLLLYFVSEDRRIPFGRLFLETRAEERAGRAVLVRSERVLALGKDTVSGWLAVDARSLAPVEERMTGSDPAVHSSATFQEGRVRGWAVRDGQRQAIDTLLAPTPFFAGGMDMLLAALPLREGFRAVLPVYDATFGFEWSAVDVGAVEDVPLADGTTERAWAVRVESHAAGGTYWISERTRELVRFFRPDKEGEEGGVMILRRSPSGGESPLRQSARWHTSHGEAGR